MPARLVELFKKSDAEHMQEKRQPERKARQLSANPIEKASSDSRKKREGRVQSLSLLLVLVRWGAPRGIKESFFHGKPNQKGKALLMMGGGRGVRGRR